MEYLSTVALTAVFTIIFLVAYKMIVNPTVVIRLDPTQASKCPDNWTYDTVGKLCRPNSKSSCMPFDPDASTIQTASAKCNLARACGTTWNGMCG
jgi:hypothetical protein